MRPHGGAQAAAPPALAQLAANKLGLSCAKVTTSDGVSYMKCSGEIPSFDRLGLDTDVSIPLDATHASQTLVMLHGWSQDKTFWEAGTTAGDGAGTWHWNNVWFVSKGWVVVNYTARGFQQSCGITDQDANCTPNVYGGGQTWLLATSPPWQSPNGVTLQLAAGVRMYPWTDLLDSLSPNGRATPAVGRPVGAAQRAVRDRQGELRRRAIRRRPGRGERTRTHSTSGRTSTSRSSASSRASRTTRAPIHGSRRSSTPTRTGRRTTGPITSPRCRRARSARCRCCRSGAEPIRSFRRCRRCRCSGS